MTDITQELRKQLRMRLQDMYGTLAPSENLIDEYIMPFILDWRNKQILELLDRLEGRSFLQGGISYIFTSAIEVERNKLKEGDDDEREGEGGFGRAG